MKWLCLDPGKTTGVAAFEGESGDLKKIDQLRGDEAVYNYLAEYDPDVVICEDFTLKPWKAKDMAFNTMDTVRLIGAIQYWCWLNAKQFVLQDPSIKPIGYRWAGIPAAKSHANSHERDAYVHGVYYLQKLGIRKPQQGAAKSG